MLRVAAVAAQALLRRGERHRWQVAAAFGLLHGFGFAGALGALDLPTPALLRALLGFNAGVELGQLAIIAVIAPLVLLMQRWPRVHTVVMRALAAAILAAGLFWFVERLLA